MHHTKDTLISQLLLERHPTEGGYFRRTYESDYSLCVDDKARLSMSAIYYMLTDDSPRGCLHKNRSDILHCYQLGAPIRYWVVCPDGIVSEHILGPNICQDEQLQLVVKAGHWKVSQLLQQKEQAVNYGLITEAVTPGFEYSDNTIARSVLDIPYLSEKWKIKLQPFIHS